MSRRLIDAPPAVLKRITPTSGSWGRVEKAPPPGTPPQIACMTEAELSRLVDQFTKQMGLNAYHTYDSRKNAEGFPDWCIAGYDRVWFLELKGWQPGRKRYGVPTLAQTDWLTALNRGSPVTARLVYPWQWHDLVQEILRSLGKR